MNHGFQRWGILLGVGLVIVVLDQITKTLVMHTMHLHESTPIIAGFFNVVKAEGEKCERCWNYRASVGSAPEHPTLCDRCIEAVT